MISGSGLLGDFLPNFYQISLPPNVGPFDDRITWIGGHKDPLKDPLLEPFPSEKKGGYRAWIRTMNNASKGRLSLFVIS